MGAIAFPGSDVHGNGDRAHGALLHGTVGLDLLGLQCKHICMNRIQTLPSAAPDQLATGEAR